MSGLSADEIAELSSKASRKRKRRVTPPPTVSRPRPDRFTFTEQGNTATLAIQLDLPFRGREALIFLLLVPTIGGAFLAHAALGIVGVILVAIAFVTVTVIAVKNAPPLSVQMTRTGDFIVYKSNPRRPSWAGSIINFRFDFLPAAAKGHWIAMLYFHPTRKDQRTEVLGYVNATELEVMKTAARWGGIQLGGVNV